MKNILKILDEIKNKPSYDILKFTPKIPALEQTMEDERIKKIVEPQLNIIEIEVEDLIFKKIRLSHELKDADQYFELLLEILGVLSKYYYADQIMLTDKLADFVYDFDISHHEYFRPLIFNRIKDDLYNYDFNKSYWGR